MGPERRPAKGRDPPGRRRLVPAEREALARRYGHNGNVAYCHSGSARRQSRRMAGESQRRRVRRIIKISTAQIRRLEIIKCRFATKMVVSSRLELLTPTVSR